MTALIASVQTADDASGGDLLVAVMVIAVLVLVIAVSAVEIHREWRRAGRVIDPVPLPRNERIAQSREVVKR